MTVPIIINYQDPGVPTLSGTEGSLSALLRYAAPLLGWDIIYDSGLIIVIRPKSYKGGQQLYYRFDDRAARGGVAPRIAKVQAYESMSGIDTGVNLVGPTYVHKSYYTNTTAQPYRIIGDQYGMYLFMPTVYNNTTTPTNVHYFGFSNAIFNTQVPVCIVGGSSDSAAIDGYSMIGYEYMLISDPLSSYATNRLYIHRDTQGSLNALLVGKSTSFYAQMSSDGFATSISNQYISNSSTLRFLLPYPYNGLIIYFPYYLHSRPAGQTYGQQPECVLPGFNAHIHDTTMPYYPTVIQSDNKQFIHMSIISERQNFARMGRVLIEISEGFRP